MKKGVQLLQDLKRARWLPHFNDKVVREVIEDMLHDLDTMKQLAEAHQNLEELTEDLTAGLVLYNDLVDRNRRCLLAYLHFRLERIDELRWEVGHWIPEDKMNRLHESEKKYLNHYNDILDRYMKKYVPGCQVPLDLTADREAPEEDLLTFRAIEEGGELATAGSGVIRLKKDQQILVKRSDLEHLVRAGKVEHIYTVRGDAASCL
eukprot:CAMPEP_0194746990 /NCGR_PEP_ID=MMETSP0323_2-20130528/1060_1 /TAXON_ID=2866 ORGANISM="Crypthecodinium cohnii, Strain Seligo" /NCGR_SAMPLE_ID=MMETSP0323_2 /ASSEMBLY_ACC=CAM_ASM_000346 /LENGTH=205 /DNA_ID=CAMNT_0039659957 /DNA_START=109 /DNA_END=726 /DNA_ORIENTATION=-